MHTRINEALKQGCLTLFISSNYGLKLSEFAHNSIQKKKDWYSLVSYATHAVRLKRSAISTFNTWQDVA